MLRRYADAEALFAFTRRLRPIASPALPKRGVGGVVEATSARRSRGNARGDAPRLVDLGVVVPGCVVNLEGQLQRNLDQDRCIVVGHADRKGVVREESVAGKSES